MPSKATVFLTTLLCVLFVTTSNLSSYAEEGQQETAEEMQVPSSEELVIAEDNNGLSGEAAATIGEGQEPPEEEIQLADEEQQTVRYNRGLYYTVKKGDTLWDLSSKFFDTPWAWPGLWQENKQLPNPHFIYPGDKIRIYSKSDVRSVPVPPAPEELEEEPEPEEIVIEEAEKELSEEEIEVVVIEENIIEEPEEDLPFFVYLPIDQVGFIKEKQVTPNGIILKAKADRILISTGDSVYVKQTGDLPIIAGSLYTIYRTADKTVTDKSTGKYVGILHTLKGVVEINEIIKRDPVVASAKIVKSYDSIKINDLLLPYKRKSSRITITESVKDLEGKFLVAKYQLQLMGEHNIAFINKGEKDGVKPGQKYSIFEQETITKGKKKNWFPKESKGEKLMPIDFGSIIILQTEETTSTVLITNSSKAVHPGTTVHPGTKIRTPAP
jgi:hypothetical protein